MTYGANDIRDLQCDIARWVEHNFGNSNELATVGGLVEECGEVMRAAVKRSQGIRGTREEWDAELRKESADVFIKLCDVAQFYGFDLATAITERWGQVRQRDWKANPQGHGIGGAA
jgi:NTP pyrophosphatase (non-canonical NTP hydrolase)